MKRIELKYLLLIVCGSLALGPLASCHLDEPEPLPQEELFLREFIKRYGLIDPEQDWNMAERQSVTIRPNGHAKVINVFVKVNGRYYRVANYADIDGEVTIPIDVPDGTEQLYVEIDGKVYQTAVGSTLNVAAASRAGSGNVLKMAATVVEQAHENQLCFAFPDGITALEKGDTWSISMDIKAATDCDKSLNVTEVENNYKGLGSLSPQLNFTTSWTSYTSTGTIGDGNNFTGGSRIDVNFGTEANDYYFDNIVFTITRNSTNYSYSIDFDTNNSLAKLSGSLGANWLSNEAKAALVVADDTPGSGSGSGSEIPATAGDMAWLLVAEDLGATDDFDFNDVIIQIKAVSTNSAALKLQSQWWQVVEDEEHIVLSRGGESRATNTYTQLTITPMCAGGILDSYLHFSDGTNDWVLQPGVFDLTQSLFLPPVPSQKSQCKEWHTWFYMNNAEEAWGESNKRQMLLTGMIPPDVPQPKSATITVPSTFSMTKYSKIFKDYYGDANSGNYGSGSKPFGDSGETYDRNSYLSDWAFAANGDYIIQGFYMTVGDPTKADSYRLLGAPNKGAAPQMFLIPDVGHDAYNHWQWPHERVPITTVYPNFAKWVKNKTNDTWYTDTPPTQQVQTYEGVWVDPVCTRIY